MAPLLQLPLEIVRNCLELLGQQMKVKEFMRLRLVCKTFGYEVLRAGAIAANLYHKCKYNWPGQTECHAGFNYGSIIAPARRGQTSLHTTYARSQFLFHLVQHDHGRKFEFAQILLGCTDILTQGASSEERDQVLWSLCHLASHSVDLYVGRLKLFGHRRPSSKSIKKSMITAAAAYLGRVDIVRQHCEDGDIDINEDSFFPTPLACAAFGGNREAWELLCSQFKTSVYIFKSPFISAYSAAASGGQDWIVKEFLENINPEEKHRNERVFTSAMIRAARGGHLNVIRTVQSFRPGGFGRVEFNRILSHAAANGHFEIVTFALENHADPLFNSDREPHNVGPDALTPLAISAGRGFTSILRLLLEKIPAHQSNCRHASYRAAMFGFTSSISILLEHGCDVDEMGEAMVFASRQGHDEVIKLLLSHSLKLSDKPKVLEGAMRFARMHKYNAVLETLQSVSRELEESIDDKDNKFGTCWSS